MSYKYYEEELKRLPANDADGYGLSIQIRAGNGEHTKWLSLTDECKDALRKFILDPEGMSDSELRELVLFWETKYRELQKIEETSRGELAKYLADPVCPATWHHIVGAVRELLLFRDCAKKVAPRQPIIPKLFGEGTLDGLVESDKDWVRSNFNACVEFLQLAERRRL